jgi:hypothetical protein
MDDKRKQYTIVLPSAQKETPPLERSVRIFLKDGSELPGIVSLRSGPTDQTLLIELP